MKLCKDCKHYSERPHPVFTRPYQECSFPDLVDPVNGDKTDASTNRYSVGGCGLDARYWEAK